MTDRLTTLVNIFKPKQIIHTHTHITKTVKKKLEKFKKFLSILDITRQKFFSQNVEKIKRNPFKHTCMHSLNEL